MGSSNMPPQINLAVAVLVRDDEVLLVYNDKWGSFSFPMTKMREWYSGKGQLEDGSEKPLDAAIRAAGEALGRPMKPAELPQAPEHLQLEPYDHRSQRDGKWKRYGRTVFVFHLANEQSRPPVHGQAWLKLEEISTHRPISPTAIEIAGKLSIA